MTYILDILDNLYWSLEYALRALTDLIPESACDYVVLGACG